MIFKLLSFSRFSRSTQHHYAEKTDLLSLAQRGAGPSSLRFFAYARSCSRRSLALASFGRFALRHCCSILHVSNGFGIDAISMAMKRHSAVARLPPCSYVEHCARGSFYTRTLCSAKRALHVTQHGSPSIAVHATFCVNKPLLCPFCVQPQAFISHRIE